MSSTPRDPSQTLQTADTPIDQAIARYADMGAGRNRPTRLSHHLRRLESESIEIMREVASEFRNPVFLYSIGKDSTVMLHLARKAFYPAPPPFPFLHIATGWDFQDMIRYRDCLVAALGLDLRVHTNADGVARGISPVASGPTLHAQVMSTEGLKQALDAGAFDAAFGGGRRDEEKSRAKERVFSFRTPQHTWDPRRQRPELWNLYNARVAPGESIRVFPLSNWTEMDVWSYIAAEAIPVVPLYFARRRPVVRRHGALILVDDGRLPLQPGETPRVAADPLPHARLLPVDRGHGVGRGRRGRRSWPRCWRRGSPNGKGRLIDHDEAASMERKKREGYF